MTAKAIFTRLFLIIAGLIILGQCSKSKANEIDYGRACLALVAFSEQNEEQAEGMGLVITTILNRLNDEKGRYGVSICDVVAQSGQFIGIERWKYPRRPQDTNPRRWFVAVAMATLVTSGNYEVPGQCASNKPILYFHSGDKPYWIGSYRLVCKVDGHWFYSEK